MAIETCEMVQYYFAPVFLSIPDATRLWGQCFLIPSLTHDKVLVSFLIIYWHEKCLERLENKLITNSLVT